MIVDTAESHERYRALLAKCRAELLLFAEGAAALSALDSIAPSLGGAIVLWELAGRPNGAELLTILHRRQPGLPIIVVSGLLDLGRAVTAKEMGARDFLNHPLERDRLCAAVDCILRPKPKSAVLQALEERLIGDSPDLRTMQESLAAAIATGEPILIVGENGTGKELLARAVHDLGARDPRHWVPVNVASIPATLMESTLFGHEPGAFTDARGRRIGLFEEAGLGTLFLDEIGELDVALQAKLLRVIQERTFRRVGGSADLPFEARLVCATNQDLAAAQTAGRFRRDLYHRLAVHEVHVPPLRQRSGDLWLLVDHFLEKHAAGRQISLARETGQLLASYEFPGNIRELESLIKDGLGKCEGTDIRPFDLPIEIMQSRVPSRDPSTEANAIVWPESLFHLSRKEAALAIDESFDRLYLPQKLNEANGNITRAAAAADLDPKTFRARWARAGLEPLSNAE